MGHAPRIGQKLSLIPKNSDEAHTVSLPPSTPLTDPAAIAEEEVLKQRMVDSLNAQHEAAQRVLSGAKTAQPPAELATEVATISRNLVKAEAAARATDRERYQRINGPKIDPLEQRLNMAKVTLDRMREAHLDRMAELAGVDPVAIRRSFRFTVTPGSAVTAGDLLTLMQREAEGASGVLRGQVFGVATDAVRRARQSSHADPSSQEWVMAGAWLRTQVSAVEATVAATAERIKNALALHAKVTEALKTATRIEDPTLPPAVEFLPNLPAARPTSDTSRIDFDPREHPSTWLPREPAPAPSAFNIPNGPGRAKVVGIEGGA